MRRSRPVIVVAVAIILAASGSVVAQESLAPQALYIVDKPTAGILPHASYMLRGRTGPEISFLLGLRIGFRDLFQIGVSAGMHDVFERGSPDVDEHIGFKLRVRVIPEGQLPAIAVGFDSQGVGRYHEDLNRYDRKSLGFYGVVSRNYLVPIGELGLHGGVNYSLENEDDSDLNVFGGTDFTVGGRISFLLDVDAALNDNFDNSPFGSGGFYVDGAVRLFAGDTIVLTLVFRDLAANLHSEVGREFEVALIEFF
jgi:hypothetical protein